MSDVCALADERRDALKSIAVKAEGLAGSLALVCGSKAIPAKFRRSLEAVAETVQEIAEIATSDGQPPAPSAPVEEPGGYDRPCPKCGAKTQFASATGEHGAGLARVCVSKTCDWRSIPTPAA